VIACRIRLGTTESRQDRSVHERAVRVSRPGRQRMIASCVDFRRRRRWGEGGRQTAGAYTSARCAASSAEGARAKSARGSTRIVCAGDIRDHNREKSRRVGDSAIWVERPRRAVRPAPPLFDAHGKPRARDGRDGGDGGGATFSTRPTAESGIRLGDGSGSGG